MNKCPSCDSKMEEFTCPQCGYVDPALSENDKKAVVQAEEIEAEYYAYLQEQERKES